MPKLYYGSVDNQGVRVHYYRTGDLKPPVVLLHGILDSGLCWNQTALALEPDYDVIMIDARGHGLSDAPEEGYTPQDHAGDVARVIEALELHRPAVIGHSMGANTAAVTAGSYPQLVGSLVLEDPPWNEQIDRDSVAGYQQWADRLKTQVETYRGCSFEELLDMSRARHPRWEEGENFQWAKAKQQVKARVVGAPAQERMNWREIAKKIQCPVLLVIGDVNLGGLMSPAAAEEANKFWRKSKVVHIPESGHNIRRDQPDLFIDEVRRFLAQRKTSHGRWA